MKNFYDKLLLLLAVLALLGGVVFYMLKIEDNPGQNFGPDLQPANNPYDPVPTPESVTVDASWPEPEPQSSGPNWLYDVFTPPKIYIDAEGNFTAKPPVDPRKTEPFGIYLAEMKRTPYRIQMQGFSGDRGKPEEAVLFLFDEERELRFLIREGETNEESQVKVLDFKIERKFDPDVGSASVTAIAIILDKRSGEEIKLNDDERLMNPEWTLVMRSNQDPDVSVELVINPRNPVTSFTTSTGEFTVQEINLEDRTVTVEKKATELSEVRTRKLSAPALKQPRESNEEENEESETPANEEVNFDFSF